MLKKQLTKLRLWIVRKVFPEVLNYEVSVEQAVGKLATLHHKYAVAGETYQIKSAIKHGVGSDCHYLYTVNIKCNAVVPDSDLPMVLNNLRIGETEGDDATD